MRKRFAQIIVVMAGLISGLCDVAAQDALRGSIRYVPGTPVVARWEGVYGGVQAGHSINKVDFKDASGSLTSTILRESILQGSVSSWATLGEGNVTENTFGGFVGFNMQWDDVVLGLEANYSQTKMSKSASDSLARILAINTNAPPDHNFFYDTTVSANAAISLSDFGTVRARAGWVIGQALPYAFGGVAIARAEVMKSATVDYVRRDVPNVTDPVTPPFPDATFGPVTETSSRKNAIAFGYAVGIGIDYAIMQNVFVRAEWELVEFPNIEGIGVRINNARVAAGLKF